MTESWERAGRGRAFILGWVRFLGSRKKREKVHERVCAAVNVHFVNGFADVIHKALLPSILVKKILAAGTAVKDY